MKKLSLFVVVICLLSLIACEKEGNENSIDITTLPTAITNYISTNYADYKIDEAQKDTLCNGTAGIEVELEKKNSNDISLFFSNENTFVLKEEEIKYNTLPIAVQTFFSSNYSNYELPKDADKITLANGTVQYEVDIKEKTSKIEKEVTTNFDGTLKICER